MKHHACGKEMKTVSGYQLIQISAHVKSGDKYLETNFDETDLGEDVYYCGECGRALTQKEAEKFSKVTE